MVCVELCGCRASARLQMGLVLDFGPQLYKKLLQFFKSLQLFDDSRTDMVKNLQPLIYEHSAIVPWLSTELTLTKFITFCIQSHSCSSSASASPVHPLFARLFLAISMQDSPALSGLILCCCPCLPLTLPSGILEITVAFSP